MNEKNESRWGVYWKAVEDDQVTQVGVGNTNASKNTSTRPDDATGGEGEEGEGAAAVVAADTPKVSPAYVSALLELQDDEGKTPLDYATRALRRRIKETGAAPSNFVANFSTRLTQQLRRVDGWTLSMARLTFACCSRSSPLIAVVPLLFLALCWWTHH